MRKPWEMTCEEFIAAALAGETYEYIGHNPPKSLEELARIRESFTQAVAEAERLIAENVTYWKSVLIQSGTNKWQYRPGVVRDRHIEAACHKANSELLAAKAGLVALANMERRIKDLPLRHAFWVDHARREGKLNTTP